MYEKLYTLDSKGKTRFWMMEQDGSRYRTISGLVDGKSVESEWTQCEAKNVGRSNATTAEEQASLEIQSQYKKKLDKKYYTQSDFDKSDSKGYKFTGPMLAIKYEKFPGPCYSQPKLDGLRAVISENGILSRQGKPYHLDHIMEALKPIFEAYPGIVLDGELYNHDLRDDFNSLVSLIKREKRTPEQEQQTRDIVQFHIYDILDDGEGTSHGFVDRYLKIRSISEQILIDYPIDYPIQVVPTEYIEHETLLDDAYAHYMEAGYEGQMVRLGGIPYEGNGKRSKSLMKRKEFEDAEFKLVRVIEGQGNWSQSIKSVECVTKEGKIFSAGLKGDKNFAKELLNRRDSPPKLVTVQYQNLTPDGIPRFPVAVKFWETEKF